MIDDTPFIVFLNLKRLVLRLRHNLLRNRTPLIPDSMPKDDTSESEAEQTSENSSGSEEREENPVDGQHHDGIAEYEKQRLSRIAENSARMEALGLRKMASSFMGSSRNLRSVKGKAKVVDEDEDYRPEEEGPGSSSEEEEKEGNENDEDEDYLGRTSSVSQQKKKLKKKGQTPKKKVPSQKHPSNSDYMDDDEALRQAIALSLQTSAEASSVVHNMSSGSSDINERKGKTQTQEDKARRKRKKSFASRLQMTEDELVVHFFQFDDEWKEGISIRDVERVATAHDFTWSDKELADMITCFDIDGDGKLSLDDFRKIATRCNIIKECEGS